MFPPAFLLIASPYIEFSAIPLLNKQTCDAKQLTKSYKNFPTFRNAGKANKQKNRMLSEPQNTSVIRKATVASSPLAKETSSMNVRQN